MPQFRHEGKLACVLYRWKLALLDKRTWFHFLSLIIFFWLRVFVAFEKLDDSLFFFKNTFFFFCLDDQRCFLSLIVSNCFLALVILSVSAERISPNWDHCSLFCIGFRCAWISRNGAQGFQGEYSSSQGRHYVVLLGLFWKLEPALLHESFPDSSKHCVMEITTSDESDK